MKPNPFFTSNHLTRSNGGVDADAGSMVRRIENDSKYNKHGGDDDAASGAVLVPLVSSGAVSPYM